MTGGMLIMDNNFSEKTKVNHNEERQKYKTFSKGANINNAPDPATIVRKIKEQKKEG